MNESRLKKSFLNARVNLIFYFITLVLAFFSRKIFLDSLGADFVGLTGTLQNLLGFLNLAEMGIGAAIGFVLYRPLFEQNREKINEIISVLGYMYRWVGTVILSVGVILSLFLPLIFSDTEFSLGIIYFVYYSFLTSSLIGYFINYRQTLLGADQRNYVVTAYYQTANICKIIIQMILASHTGNYYLWALIELTFGVIYSVILNYKINQVYPWLKSNIRSGKALLREYPDLITHTKQLFVHKIGAVVYQKVSPFLVYAFASLEIVACYGNYILVVSKLDGLANNLLNSTSAGVGNLIAEGNKDKVLRVYWELMAIRFFIAGVFIFSLYHLLPPFIVLWLGDQYLLSSKVLVLILITYFLGLVRGTTEQFVFGFGLFSDIWAPFVEAIILITVALIGGSVWGFEGVLLGGIVSTIIIIYIWKPYFLFSRGFHLPIWRYWMPWLKNCVVMIVSILSSQMILNGLKLSWDFSLSWLNWFTAAVIITSIQVVVSFALYYISVQGMRDFTLRIKKRLLSKLKV